MCIFTTSNGSNGQCYGKEEGRNADGCSIHVGPHRGPAEADSQAGEGAEVQSGQDPGSEHAHRRDRGARHQGAKKSWGQAVERLNVNTGYSITYCSELLGRSKQAYYKKQKHDDEYLLRVMHIVDAVKQIRQMDPGIGYYKLRLMSKRMFLCDWVPGRDAFLQILRDFQLTQRRPKPRHTTNSNHRYHRYKNLIRGFMPTRPNQLWVSNITYIDLVGDCCYLHLVTDAYSHKIVGWCLSDTLEAEYTHEALRMAISQATADELRGLVHHSDRGVQYCSNAYTDELKRYGLRISMTEDYKPTDNAIAERVNGILKTEVIYREKRFKTYQDALERISSFIAFYNETRPHSSIGMKTPSEAHKEQGPQRIMWKPAGTLSGAVCPPLPLGPPP